MNSHVFQPHPKNFCAILVADEDRSRDMQAETTMPSAVTVIKCGFLFDGSNLQSEAKYIHVVNNTISDVSSEGRWKYDGHEVRVTEIDLSEHFVMPGMIDCHVHPCILDVKYAHDHFVAL